MFFSIKKFQKIQIHHYRAPSESDIKQNISRDGLKEKSMISEIMRIHARKVEDLIENGHKLAKELDTYGIKELKPYFIKHPSAWYDLKRKIHAHKIKNGDVPIDHIDEVDFLTVFLRHSDGAFAQRNSIEQSWRKEILQNERLLTTISHEPSFMDSSHGQLDLIDISGANNQKAFLSKIIQVSLDSNQPTENHGEYDQILEDIFPKITFYMESIFGIKTETLYGDQKPSVNNLANTLSKTLFPKKREQQKTGTSKKHAWMIMKSFRAWGALKEIEEMHNHATEGIENIIEKLKGIGFDVQSGEGREEYSFKDTIHIHTGTMDFINLQGKIIKVGLEYRVKSLRSILLKLWETEDYNNIDALRDMIGLSFIFPDEVSESDKKFFMKSVAQSYIPKAYIIKNKGFIHDEKGFFSLFKQSPSPPFGGLDGVNKKKGVHSHKTISNKDFINASLSGFQSIRGKNIGIEMQFLTYTAYKKSKDEHSFYDPKKVISAWSRGSWFLTPKQLNGVIKSNIHPDILSKNHTDIASIIMQYLSSGDILAFHGKNQEVYFVPKNHSAAFQEKFPQAMLIDQEEEDLKKFIREINVSSSINGMYHTPSVLDR